jgi:signal transduction histidine kinase
VQGLVETLGGKVWFVSQENVGSTFYFSLPLKTTASRQSADLTGRKEVLES